MKKSMTVRELREALMDLPGDLPVYISVTPLIGPHTEEDFMYYVRDVKEMRASAISNHCVDIETGDGFGW